MLEKVAGGYAAALRRLKLVVYMLSTFIFFFEKSCLLLLFEKNSRPLISLKIFALLGKLKNGPFYFLWFLIK